jgi:hypothetical protein
MSEDRKPKNLTKKLKRSSTKPKKVVAEAEEAPAEAPKKA